MDARGHGHLRNLRAGVVVLALGVMALPGAAAVAVSPLAPAAAAPRMAAVDAIVEPAATQSGLERRAGGYQGTHVRATVRAR